MSARFTLGIEEEFQIVDCRTGQLAPQIKTILAKGTPAFGDKLKPEMLQSTVELVSPVFPNIMLARIEMRKWRRMLAELLAEQGLALVSAGTHPSAHWGDQVRSESERYAELEDEYQDVGRSILIFGLHVHVGVENKEVAIALMNQLRTWLPHLLALSSNSPFWAGRYTGLKSYRSVVWKRFPRSGLPEVFATADDFDKYVQTLVVTNCIDNGKRIWWDIRPHPFFETIEFRVFDMPATFDDMIALAALSQALVAKLCWLYEHGTMTQVLPRRFIDENKWRAMRYGLDAELIDFVRGWRLSARDAISELLDFVDDVLDDLGSRSEIDHVRLLLEDPRGTGADRQIALYKETNSVRAVIDFLMEQTMAGVMLEELEQSLAS